LIIKKLEIVGVLKVTDENCRIRSRILLLCQRHGTATLVISLSGKIIHDYKKRSPTYELCGIDELWHICPEGENILASILPNFYTE
jgi:hypothetical protein